MEQPQQMQAAAAAIVASKNAIQTVHSGASRAPRGQIHPVNRADGTKDAVEAEEFRHRQPALCIETKGGRALAARGQREARAGGPLGEEAPLQCQHAMTTILLCCFKLCLH